MVHVPKDFSPEDNGTWTHFANGRTTTIPFRLHPDYVMSPFSEIAVGNTPPAIRFDPNGHAIQGPLANMTLAPTQTRRCRRRFSSICGPPTT